MLGGLAYKEKEGAGLAETLSIVLFIAFFALVIVFEVIFRLFKRKESPFIDAERVIPRSEFD